MMQTSAKIQGVSHGPTDPGDKFRHTSLLGVTFPATHPMTAVPTMPTLAGIAPTSILLYEEA
ncbi:MAG: hypothetical protein A2289_08845 [Deltaproteobacteria bacterium RIFOXYA12_FULL_58_15]|nr:MAG: hypothetical protein A2289_08845 [Deltaproteobacteria bacterium RIFOXYA12_FULL_58_15]